VSTPEPAAPGGRWGRGEVLDAFEEAAHWLAAVVGRIGPGQWSHPGLGVWTVQELAGHAGRALVTVEEYLTDPGLPPDPHPGGAGGTAGDAGTAAPGDGPVAGAATYFLGVRDNARLHQDVAERGKQAGAALGANPGSTPAGDVAALVDRVVNHVRAAGPDAVFTSRFGPVPFATYLATRVVELVVHGIDLERACGFDYDVPARAGSLAVAVVGELAVRRGAAGEVLEALGGRGPLPERFGVFE